MELHGDSGGEDTGAVLDKIAAETTVESLSGAGGRLWVCCMLSSRIELDSISIQVQP